jgi:hypothetical protein
MLQGRSNAGKIMAESKGEGIFIFAVLLITAMALQVAGVGGLGTDRFSQYVVPMLVGAGALAYFIVKSAGSFGIESSQKALGYAGLALAFAMIFTALLVHVTTGVLTTMSTALIIACGAPLVALFVRSGAITGRLGGAKGVSGGKPDTVQAFGSPIAVSGVADASKSNAEKETEKAESAATS